jgi:hypothetical protein
MQDEYRANRFIQAIMDTGWKLTSEEQQIIFNLYLNTI